MYPVSQEFLEKMFAKSRDVVGLVRINYTDPFLDDSVEASSTDLSRTSYPSQIANGVTSPSYKYASFDGTWKLGHGYHLSPNEASAIEFEKGWWSGSTSDANGDFTSPYPSITLEFFSRPIREYKVVGDDKRGEYPVDFDIENYDIDGTLIETEIVTDNDQVEWVMELETEIPEIAKQILVIKKWSHPNTNAKILEFFSSIIETYEIGDLVEINLVEELETSQTGLPVGIISSNELTVTLVNRDRKFDVENSDSNLYNLIRANRRIEAFLGVRKDDLTLELVPLGVFWSGNWDVPERDVTARTDARDRLDLLRNSSFLGTEIQASVSFYDLFEQVLIDAGVSDYDIDLDLQSIIVPFGYLDRGTHRQALKTLAEASLSQVFCSREDAIVVNRIGNPSVTIVGDIYINEDFELIVEDPYEDLTFSLVDGNLIATFDLGTGFGQADYFDKTNPTKWDEIANYIEVNTSPLQMGTSRTVFSISSEPILISQQLTIECVYNESPCGTPAITVSGNATLVSSDDYAWGTIVVVEGTADGTFGIQIDANVYEVNSAQRVVSQDEASIRDNGTRKFTVAKNPLIQTRSQAKEFTDAMLDLYKNPRGELDSQWRGNPSWELGDNVGLTDRYSVSVYRIVKQELIYNGGLSGIIEGRKVSI